VPVAAGQVRIRLLPNDTTYGLTWTEVRTANISFVIPSSWELATVTVNANGLATLDTPFLRIDGKDIILIVNTQSGAIDALIDGNQVSLRSKAGKLIELPELVEEAGELAPVLRHLLESIRLSGDLAE
jgi:hypothetical protein